MAREAVAFELAEALRAALDDAGVEPMGLAGIGVGAPGSIDAESGTVLQVANIDGWDDPFPLGPTLAAELGRPVRIGNDVNVAVDAEHRFGAGRGLQLVPRRLLGHGRRRWHRDGRAASSSGRGSAGEIGHVCSKPGGRRCNCGLEGCVEAYAGRGALEERARELAKERPTVLFELMEKRGRDRLTSGVWLRALQAGDEVAEELILRAVQALGVGIGSAVTLLDVEAVDHRRRSRRAARCRLAGPDRGGRERAHLLPGASGVPARRARRSRRCDRREPARVTVAIVTGAGRGIGAAVARRLHGDGWTVVLADLDGDAVGALAAELGSDAVPVAMDVRDPESWARAVGAAHEAGDLGALVNGAARTVVRDLFAIEPEEWDDVLATNLRGPFLGIRAVGPHLRDRGAGRIVNIASDSAFRGRGVTGAHYATSKAGLIALTRRAAAALAPAGVTVNAVAPGTIDGETVRELAGDRIDELAAEIPAGRLGRPEEIAALVAWLLSDDAAYVNGATLLADGGAAL